jgi:hypothetical protein
MNEHVIHKTHVTPASHQEREWTEYFQYAFTPEQAQMLSRMLFGCSADWRKEWEKRALDAACALQDVLQGRYIAKLCDDVADHRDALLELRAEVDVLLSIGKLSDAVEIPKFINGKAVVQKKAPESDVLVDRIYDVEKLAARIERQIKDILHRLSNDRRHLIAEAMVRVLTKRVEALQAQIKQNDKNTETRIEAIEGRIR